MAWKKLRTPRRPPVNHKKPGFRSDTNYLKALEAHNDDTGLLLLPKGLELATCPVEEIPEVGEKERRTLATKQEITLEVTRRKNPENYSHLWGKSLREVKEEIAKTGGPQATRNNAFTLGVPTTEIYVMHGETASAAAFSRRLVKEQDAGHPLEPVIDKMNALAQQYYDQSSPVYCAKAGLVDEIIPMPQLRDYFIGFARTSYQNPKSICPQHQMLLPRSIRG